MDLIAELNGGCLQNGSRSVQTFQFNLRECRFNGTRNFRHYMDSFVCAHSFDTHMSNH